MCSINMIIAYPALLWRLAARRSAQVMAVALGKRCNAAARRHSSALRVGLSAPMDCVAPLAKGYGHYLRDAPCHERGQTNWIRNYHVDGALAVQLYSAHIGGYTGYRFNIVTTGEVHLPLAK